MVYIGKASLRKPPQLVTDFSKLPKIIEDMAQLMYKHEGIGLASTQAGVDLQIFLLSPNGRDYEVMVNPKILAYSEKTSTFDEGCLSVPGAFATVYRPVKIKVEYQDETGKLHTEMLKGMRARIFQHEYDHLQGMVFIDRLSPNVRKRALYDLNLPAGTKPGLVGDPGAPEESLRKAGLL